MIFGREVKPFNGSRYSNFNPIFLIILKWLKFGVVSWRHDFQPCTTMVWDYFIVGLL
jgi:hypothetical protein